MSDECGQQIQQRQTKNYDKNAMKNQQHFETTPTRLSSAVNLLAHW